MTALGSRVAGLIACRRVHSWFTQGLIEAGKAGNTKAFPLLRGMYDWFDDPDLNPYQPYLCELARISQPVLEATALHCS